jgi:2'-5' RNA ligase
MKKRTIMIFPQFENVHVIDDIRKKFDPLADHVRPHITLVFPFESDITSTRLKEHLEKVLAGIRSFRLTMNEIIKLDSFSGMYLFLTVNEGIEDIKRLSSKLYTGILEPYKPEWLNEKTFLPHMTIGKFTSRDDLDKAFKEVGVIRVSFTTTVNKVSAEIIGENEDSIIDIEVNL